MAAAGSIVFTHQNHRSVRMIEMDWTSNAAGAVSGNLSPLISGEILRAVFIPGSGGTQPTDLYDTVLLDSDGLDVLNGKGANLSQTNKTTIAPLLGDGTTIVRPPAVDSILELQVSNAGNAKTGVVKIFYR